MRFHPEFRLEKEQRLIAQQPVSSTPAEAPKTEGTPEKTDDQKKAEAKERIARVKEQLEKDPKGLAIAAELRINEAEEDAQKMHEESTSALARAAEAYFHAILEPGKETEALAKVKNTFGKGGVQMKLEEGKWKFETATGSPEAQKPLTEDQKAKLEEIVNDISPPFKEIARSITEKFMRDPDAADIPGKTFDAYKSLSPEAKKIFPRFALSLGTRERIPFPSPAVQEEYVQYVEQIGDKGQDYLRIMAQQAQQLLRQGEKPADSKDLTAQDREDILKGAKKTLMDEKGNPIDFTKASEIDKGIALARLQMYGIDVNNGEEILKDPSKIKVFEGTPFERGFNKIMGLIGFVLAHIEKLRQIGKPKEKKGEQSKPPEPAKTGPAPEKEALRKKLKDEIKNGGRPFDDVKREKENKQRDNQISAGVLEKELADLKDEKPQNTEEQSDLETKRNDLTKRLQERKQEEARLGQEVTEMGSMKQESEAFSQSLEQGRKTLEQLATNLPEAKSRPLLEALKFSVIVDPANQVRLQPLDRGAPRDVFEGRLNVLTGRIGKALNEAIHIDADKVLQNPEELKQVMDQATASLREEINRTNNPSAAPAVPGAAPAATPTPPPARS